MTRADRKLERVREKLKDEALPASLRRVGHLCRSRSSEDRLLGLLLMQEQIVSGELNDEYLHLARRLAHDLDESCRWQSLFVIAEFIETDPSAVWQVVVEHGSGADSDMRSAVATILLERLLADHFDNVFRRLETQVRRGNRNLTDTLRRCWMFGGAKSHSREVDRLIRSRVGDGAF